MTACTPPASRNYYRITTNNMEDAFLEDLVIENNTKIVLLVIDGLGGLPLRPSSKTELEVAKTPNLDRLARVSSCGLLDPISPGITPGSGPAHLGLFGYDPVKYNIGRGVLAALGIDFNLKPGDICTRANFATIDKNDLVTDRRAGRISTETNTKLCRLLGDKVNVPQEYKLFIETVKEHRAVLILRGEGLDENIADTDPQKTGIKPLVPQPTQPTAQRTALLFTDILRQAQDILKNQAFCTAKQSRGSPRRGQPKANMMLLRGFAKYHPYPTMQQRFKIKSLAIAGYPMYRGLAKLVGMDTTLPTKDLEEGIKVLKEKFSNYDYFYIHVKKTDSFGEDGNFKDKVKKIEYVDKLIPKILDLKPDVFILTCDHSTPAKLKAHSWHPCPLLLYSQYCRQDNLKEFSESSCRCGSLSRQPSLNLMPLVLANALRLKKYGA